MECLLESTKRSNSIYSTHPQRKQNIDIDIDIDNETTTSLIRIYQFKNLMLSFESFKYQIPERRKWEKSTSSKVFHNWSEC
jgi:hypothetical protein